MLCDKGVDKAMKMFWLQNPRVHLDRSLWPSRKPLPPDLGLAGMPPAVGAIQIAPEHPWPEPSTPISVVATTS